MQWDCQEKASLAEVYALVASHASRVEVLLARHFPAGGGCLQPDGSGHVRVVQGSGRAMDRPASVYARCVAKLGPLVAAFSAAAVEQAAIACIREAKERTVFSCAFNMVRHPLDPLQRQLFVARMMPQPEALYRQDDATASCIWLRLWTLHAWILELRLAIGLSGGLRGGSSDPDERMLRSLDAALGAMLQPKSVWLAVELGDAEAGVMVARAPNDALPVGNLAWPSLIGALVPEAGREAQRRSGISVCEENGRAGVSFYNRFAEMPSCADRVSRPQHGVCVRA